MKHLFSPSLVFFSCFIVFLFRFFYSLQIAYKGLFFFFFFPILRIIAASEKGFIVPCRSFLMSNCFKFFFFRWLFLLASFLKRFCDYPKHRRKLNAKDLVKRSRKLIFHRSVVRPHTRLYQLGGILRPYDFFVYLTLWCWDHTKWWHKSFFYIRKEKVIFAF